MLTVLHAIASLLLGLTALFFSINTILPYVMNKFYDRTNDYYMSFTLTVVILTIIVLVILGVMSWTMGDIINGKG